ncbi:MAG: hypothetical protein ACP5JO_05450 [Candidatus Ratteibacteria bacterium]
MSYSKPNTSASTGTRNRVHPSPLSGLCVTCLDGCIERAIFVAVMAAKTVWDLVKKGKIPEEYKKYKTTIEQIFVSAEPMTEIYSTAGYSGAYKTGIRDIRYSLCNGLRYRTGEKILVE